MHAEGDAGDRHAAVGGLGPAGHIAVNQMYVRYMVPQGGFSAQLTDAEVWNVVNYVRSLQSRK